MKSNAFTIKEVDSIYVDPKDRFVVSLIVGYGSEGMVTDPRMAAASALALTTDDGRSGTSWFVYDRKTGEMHHHYEQSDFYELEVK